MKLKIAIGLAAIFGIALTSASLAETKPTKASGVYCEQGSQNFIFPASRFKPDVRSRLRIGQKKKINIAGFGPLDCRVY